MKMDVNDHQQNVQHGIRLCNDVVARRKGANTANFTDHNVKQDIGRFFYKMSAILLALPMFT
jgi:hypothetical protein